MSEDAFKLNEVIIKKNERIKQLEDALREIFQRYENLEIIEDNVNGMTLADLLDEIECQKKALEEK